jgi:serine/threonine protein kinase HipA of HipAB toxin-antitoxin module
MAARLGLPEDIRLWTEKHILLALSQWGESTIGNFLVGEASYQRLFAIEADSKIDTHRKTEAYQKLAELSLAGEQVGSSAGGEQPKFGCLTSHKSNECAHVLVKFSLGAAANDNARRWADLLQTEALALHTLAEQNISAASAQVFFGNGGEVFLEIERFDRVGLHGRKGIISLEAVAAEFLGGRAANWIDAAKFLLQQGIIDRRCFDRIGQLYAFGRLIANSDMHPGNLSFIDPLHFPLQLSPVYDMLPMAFAPGSSGNMRQSVAKIVLDTQLSKDCWLQAQAWAISFWQRVVTSETISEAFRQLASEMLALVSGLTAEINRLA